MDKYKSVFFYTTCLIFILLFTFLVFAQEKQESPDTKDKLVKFEQDLKELGFTKKGPGEYVCVYPSKTPIRETLSIKPMGDKKTHTVKYELWFSPLGLKIVMGRAYSNINEFYDEVKKIIIFLRADSVERINAIVKNIGPNNKKRELPKKGEEGALQS